MKTIASVLVAALILVAGGCAYPPGYAPQEAANWQSAAVMGAVGAGAGALIDHHNPWRGAMIGTAVGAVTGYGLSAASQQAAYPAYNQGYYAPPVYAQPYRYAPAPPPPPVYRPPVVYYSPNTYQYRQPYPYQPRY